MQVILLQDIKGLGKKGALVSVADGFARNSLIPTKKAAEVSAKVRMQVEREVQARVEKSAKKETLLTELKNKLNGKTFQLKAKADEKGHLFGAVRETQIAELLQDYTKKPIDKSVVWLNAPIKTVGEHVVEIRLGNLTAQVKLQINKE